MSAGPFAFLKASVANLKVAGPLALDDDVGVLRAESDLANVTDRGVPSARIVPFVFSEEQLRPRPVGLQRIVIVTSKRRTYIEETHVHRSAGFSKRGSGRSSRYLSPNELIHDAHDRVAFVRLSRVREKNLFPNTGDATGLIEGHMPHMPAAIVKRNAVMWNCLTSFRHRTPFTYSADK